MVTRWTQLSASLIVLILISNMSTGFTTEQDQDASSVYIPAGEFLMGSDHSPYPNDQEGPIRKVKVDDFWIDKYEVTNHEFSEFITETGYQTDSERYGWSFVVDTFLSEEEDLKATEAVGNAPWWAKVYGATWNSPEGPDTNINDRQSHPVVHVSWNDANEYCKWIGGRLPTEAEWEYAARGGLDQKLFPWGNERGGPNKQHMANIFQGNFPRGDIGLDGFVGSAPVGAFPPNGYGLYDMSGNVWEWTSSNWGDFRQPNDDIEDLEESTIEEKVCKGGSFMCHRTSCYRWRCSARIKNSKDSSSYNVGFRCVKDPERNDTLLEEDLKNIIL